MRTPAGRLFAVVLLDPSPPDLGQNSRTLLSAGHYKHKVHVQWWFVKLSTFVPSWYFRINKFSGLLKRPLVWTRKSVPALFVRTSEISGLSEPGLTNHHCTSHSCSFHFICSWFSYSDKSSVNFMYFVSSYSWLTPVMIFSKTIKYHSSFIICTTTWYCHTYHWTRWWLYHWMSASTQGFPVLLWNTYIMVIQQISNSYITIFS